MKDSGICPKCQSAGVIKVKAFNGNATANRVQLSKWGMQFAFYDNLICSGCGYMEQYLNLEDKGWQKWLKKQKEENALDTDFV
ncbi:MAG: hypothetical protein SH808_09820 [Saprospiraceae bacterium]|nr:hypothetical protein [Saprospiraceae bacterium]